MGSISSGSGPAGSSGSSGLPGLGIAGGLGHGDYAPAGPDPELIEPMQEAAVRYFPTAEPEPAAIDTCLYTNTEDERFILERHGRIVVGSACSGHGFKFAPIVGERLADLATRP